MNLFVLASGVRLQGGQLFLRPAGPLLNLGQLLFNPGGLASCLLNPALVVYLLVVLQTRPKNSPIDGVGIMAILNKPTGPELLLQKQYRPPVDKVVIEVPAGLIDEGETPEECAVRELKEETGYVGVAERTSTVMFNGGFSIQLKKKTS